MATWQYGNVLLAGLFVQRVKFSIAAGIVNLNTGIRRRSHRNVLVLFNLLQG